MPAFGPDLSLSSTQTELLIAALNSNQPSQQASTMSQSTRDMHDTKASSTPSQGKDMSEMGSGRLEFEDSPFLDYPLDGENDESFNFDETDDLFGDLPTESMADSGTGNSNGTHDPEHLHDKRKSMGGGDEDDDEDDEGGGKRREGEDKQNKKPGRKPLMSEPTTKRKAQNRAAQRAFRERKEKHLKDLETKVEDLEKASESTNHENSLLKAQVERLQVELKEYRKRLSWVSGNTARRQSSNGWNRVNTNSTGSSDFQFQFPKFGDNSSNNGNSTGSTNAMTNGSQNPGAAQRASTLPMQHNAGSLLNSVGRSSMSSHGSQGFTSRQASSSASPAANSMTASPVSTSNSMQLNNIDNFTGLFSPSILEATKNSPNSYFGADQTSGLGNGRGSLDNTYSSVPGLYSGSSVSNTESPGSLSDAQNHLSSIGTSPDPIFNSPNNKVQDFGLNTINEEGNLGQWNFNTNGSPEFDPSGFNVLARQNGGGFDPVLFGDYRDTTENLLSQDFGSFFNDAYPLPELGSPNHNYSELSNTQSIENSKTNDLMAKVDAAKNSDMSRPVDAPKLMTCNKIWDRLQSMEKFRNGEIDIDNLCSELRAKAKCSEGGAVVEEKHVNRILGL